MSRISEYGLPKDCHSVVEPKTSCRGETAILDCTKPTLLPRRFAPALAHPTAGAFLSFGLKKKPPTGWGWRRTGTYRRQAYNTRLCHCGSNTLPYTSAH